MSGKLDQSLDEIVGTRRKAGRNRRNNKTARSASKIAPVGGIKKSTKPLKSATKGIPTGPSSAPRESRIQVSGLPVDVTEAQIKEYFQKSVGAIKRVIMSYNKDGNSRGLATIHFAKADAAAKAAKDLNGMLVDKRPMKIEVLVDASHVPAPAPVKSLGERVAANPKAQPKSATTTKGGVNGTKGGKVAGRAEKPKQARQANRPKPKTTEELDAEMTDYWGTNNNAATAMETTGAVNGAAEPAAGGEDLGMDEISVGSIEFIT